MGEIVAKIVIWILEMSLNAGGAGKTDLKISDNMLNMSNWLWNYLMIIGLGLTIIHFLFEINQKLALEGRDLNIKSVMSPFLKFAVAFILLSHGSSIVTNVLGFHNTFMDKAATFEVADFTFDYMGTAIGEDDPAAGSGETGEDMDEETAKGQIETAINGIGLLQLIGLLPFILIMAVIQIILSLVWKYKALVYKLELLWKVGITPVALSDIYNGGHSNAIRWLKGLIATAVYGGSFILLTKLGSSMILGSYTDIATSLTSGGGEAFFTVITDMFSFLVIPFAELGVLSAIKQATKEAFG